MALIDLSLWLEEFSGPGWIIFAKRLSGNDTLANATHQAGPYIPKALLFEVIPGINRPDALNPEASLDLSIDSHSDRRRVRAIWYNNKLFGRTRDEARITNFGGRSSPLLDPDSTGALAIFAFRVIAGAGAPDCHVWVARDPIEEDLMEDRIGPVEPGRSVVHRAGSPRLAFILAPERRSCWLSPKEMPARWAAAFPSGAVIARKSVELRPSPGLSPDARLLKRLECEYEVFRSVEHAVELPAILAGFATVDDFLVKAQTILQRRKSRAGRSLELQTREIFIEERLREGVDFAHQPESEPGKRPDFLFPSQAAYRNPRYPVAGLRMLAVKTTCKDRWRQVINEADRIRAKHLLTLQNGVSEAQFQEMSAAGVQLVIPAGNIASFPKAVRPRLQTLEDFIAELRRLNPAGGKAAESGEGGNSSRSNRNLP